MEKPGTKASLTGWRNSLNTSAGCRTTLSKYRPVSSTNQTVVRPSKAPLGAKPKANTSSAFAQARLKPHRPITDANKATGKCWSQGIWHDFSESMVVSMALMCSSGNRRGNSRCELTVRMQLKLF